MSDDATDTPPQPRLLSEEYGVRTADEAARTLRDLLGALPPHWATALARDRDARVTVAQTAVTRAWTFAVHSAPALAPLQDAAWPPAPDNALFITRVDVHAAEAAGGAPAGDAARAEWALETNLLALALWNLEAPGASPETLGLARSLEHNLFLTPAAAAAAPPPPAEAAAPPTEAAAPPAKVVTPAAAPPAEAAAPRVPRRCLYEAAARHVQALLLVGGTVSAPVNANLARLLNGVWLLPPAAGAANPDAGPRALNVADVADADAVCAAHAWAALDARHVLVGKLRDRQRNAQVVRARALVADEAERTEARLLAVVAEQLPAEAHVPFRLALADAAAADLLRPARDDEEAAFVLAPSRLVVDECRAAPRDLFPYMIHESRPAAAAAARLRALGTEGADATAGVTVHAVLFDRARLARAIPCHPDAAPEAAGAAGAGAGARQ